MTSLRSRLPFLLPLLLCGLVLLLVLADWYLSLSLSPLFHSPAIDEAVHWNWAQALAQGHGSPEVPFFRAPLYPWLLGLFAQMGLGLAGMRVAGCLLVLATLALLVHWAHRLGGQRAAVAMGALALLNAALLYYAPMLLIPVLLVPLGAGTGYALYRVLHSPRPLPWVLLAGVLLGLAVIARPTALALLPPALALLWFGRSAASRQDRLAGLTGFLLALALPVAQVAAFNGWPGSGVLIASQGGVNFWIGNNPAADGATASLPGVGQAWERSDSRAEAARHGATGPAAESSWYYNQGLGWIREHPAHAATLWLRKTALVLARLPLGNNTPIPALSERSPGLHWLLQWGWSALLFLGLGGLLEGQPDHRPLRRWLAAVIALELFVVVAFFVNTRFLLSASVLLMLPAACWLATLSQGSRLVEHGRAVLGATALAAALLAFSPVPVVVGLLAGGLVGWLPQGLARWRFAVPALVLCVYSSAWWFPVPWLPWALAAVTVPGWLRLLWPAHGFRHPRLLALLALAPVLVEFGSGTTRPTDLAARGRSRMHFQEGNAWLRLQQPDSAARSYTASLLEWDHQPEVRLNLGILAERRGDAPGAARWYREELQLDPSSAKAHNNLGNLALRQDLPEVAIRAYTNALRLRPGLADASWNLGLAQCRLGLQHLAAGDTSSARALLSGADSTEYNGPSHHELAMRLGLKHFR